MRRSSNSTYVSCTGRPRTLDRPPARSIRARPASIVSSSASGRARRRAAQQRAHAAAELPDRERLRDVVVRAELEPEHQNFQTAARQGIEAQVYWPGVGQVRATELVLRRLLPLAYQGLASWGVDDDEAQRFLGIIEQRCLLGTNGAEWFATGCTPRAPRSSARRRSAGRWWPTGRRCTPTSRSTRGRPEYG